MNGDVIFLHSKLPIKLDYISVTIKIVTENEKSVDVMVLKVLVLL